MAKQVSKGVCAFCHAELKKAGMTKHLEACEKRMAAETLSGKRASASPARKLHLLVEGRDLLEYWMHLEVVDTTTLAALDRFLRDTWLECCGHLSAFEIGGVRYATGAGMGDDWGMEEKSMRVRLEHVLSPGQSGLYEYDYGTTTELKINVIGTRETATKGQAIRILARNTPPRRVCDVCGQEASDVCSVCIFENKGWLCKEHKKSHECGEDMLLPVVNSPRVGMCAYTG
ncbi:hypothetical protein KSC_040080 [Ktedonobacter sp. SOSP1-52]|uniref:IS1096 element passenger TnpR family protein n=1 Tax=Ktedonobacter sp. SOSP1-52 TaxID=2778366 RepID=UPI001915BFEC|nr:hypothetical protein [Ktedonobacter sp. SOSP1-52]GHO65116.1 hypothetical protein KSC_040080 [Ktedonobacter sp. SOSP1-52]